MKYKFSIVSIILLIPVFLSVCNRTSVDNKNKTPVAKAGDTYLYKNTLNNVINDNIPKADSTTMADNFIKTWVKQQLLFETAKNNLTDKEQDLKDKIADYRKKLLIHKYKEKFLSKNFDTTLKKKKLHEFYKKNTTEFKLQTPALKGLMIKLPKSAPDLAQIKRRYRSSRPEDSIFIENYCYEHVENYQDYTCGWFKIQKLRHLLPVKIKDENNFLKTRNYIQTSDSLYQYFVRIDDYKLKSEVAPFQMVKSNVKEILLNKEKLNLLNNLENKLYNKALESNKVKYFNR